MKKDSIYILSADIITKEIMQDKFLPYRIYNILDEFVKYRKLEYASSHKKISRETLIKDIRFDGFVSLSCVDQKDKIRRYPESKRKTLTYFYVLDENSIYGKKSPKFVNLIKKTPNINRTSRKNNIEIIVISRDPFGPHLFKKMNELMEDEDSDAGYLHIYNYPYFIFLSFLPGHNDVPLHNVLTQEKQDELLTHMKKKITQFGIIKRSDPPVIWIDGRPGDMIRIENPSEAAGVDISYKRVV